MINELQEVSKSNGINTNLSDIDINDINHSFIPSEYDRIELERNDSEFDYVAYSIYHVCGLYVDYFLSSLVVRNLRKY